MTTENCYGCQVQYKGGCRICNGVKPQIGFILIQIQVNQYRYDIRLPLESNSSLGLYPD